VRDRFEGRRGRRDLLGVVLGEFAVERTQYRRVKGDVERDAKERRERLTRYQTFARTA
jgi:hypothetical protein